MKIGTRVKIKQRPLKWLKEHLIEVHERPSVGIGSKELDDIFLDQLLIKGFPYEAKVVNKAAFEKEYVVEIKFNKKLKNTSVFEQKDLIVVRK